LRQQSALAEQTKLDGWRHAGAGHIPVILEHDRNTSGIPRILDHGLTSNKLLA